TAEGVNGRRLIPSVFDFANKRMFAIGGRNGLDEYKDVWAIYPDVTGAACQNLDPYEPYRPSVPPTATTGPTRVPPTPGPGPTGQPWQPPAPNPQPCDQITNRVPNAVIAQALASKGTDPSNFLLCNPGLPISPYNHYRDRLSLQDFGKNYHPVFNPVQWQCGCP
ncbi:MAG: hypothetical protein ACE5GE_15545, partial [Phycisphaerae bacterium]